MNKLWLLSLLFLVRTVPALAADPFLGVWKTDDGAAEVELFIKEGKYAGRIVTVDAGKFWSEAVGKLPAEKQPKATGELLVFDLEKTSPTELEHGKVRDIENNKTYSAKAEMDGEELVFRFYEGIPLLGKTEHWKRVKPQTKALRR